MSFLLGFFLEATLGMIGFWFLEVSSLLFVYMLFKLLLLRPHVSDRHAARRRGARSCERMPLQYLAYFPGGRVPGQDSRGATWLRGWLVQARLGRVLHRRCAA